MAGDGSFPGFAHAAVVVAAPKGYYITLTRVQSIAMRQKQQNIIQLLILINNMFSALLQTRTPV